MEQQEIFMWITAVIRWMHLTWWDGPNVILAMTALESGSSTTEQAKSGGTSSSGSGSSSVFAGLMQDFYDLGVGIPLLSSRST